MFEPIQTLRLTLREWSETDLSAAYSYASDRLVVQFMPFGPQSETESKRWLAGVIESQGTSPRIHYYFAVVLNTAGEVIGDCNVALKLDASRQDAELSYMYHRLAWGNGYATEAARAVLQFSFEQLGVHRVYATVDLENTASIRVLEKIGMRQEGLLVRSFRSHIEWRDHYLYAILENEWALDHTH